MKNEKALKRCKNKNRKKSKNKNRWKTSSSLKNEKFDVVKNRYSKKSLGWKIRWDFKNYRETKRICAKMMRLKTHKKFRQKLEKLLEDKNWMCGWKIVLKNVLEQK